MIDQRSLCSIWATEFAFSRQGIVDAQFHTKCKFQKYPFSVLMKRLCTLKVHCVMTQGCEIVDSSKNDRLRYEMIGKTHPKMEL